MSTAFEMSLSSGRAALIAVLPADCCPCELCVDVKGVEAGPVDVSPLSLRREGRAAVQPARYSTCTITPFTGDRNLSPMPRQCQWQPKPDCVVSSGNWSLSVHHCDFLALWCVLAEKRVHSPKSSDSNRHVSPTPTLRHQARKLAVLSRAKKEPEGALCRHGILRWGILCWRHRGVSRCLHVCYTKMNLRWRISHNFHCCIPLGHWSEHGLLLYVWQRENKHPPGWLGQPNPQSFHQNIEPHTLYLHWFLLHLLRLWFQLTIMDLFHTDQYGRWRARKPGLLYQAFYDLGSNDMLMGFSPHTVCSGRFMRLAVVLYRICASVLWERCNELMLEICRLLWVFFFSFQALLLTFSGILCCWITLHSWRNNVGHIASIVWSNNQNGMLLFLRWLAESSAPLNI